MSHIDGGYPSGMPLIRRRYNMILQSIVINVHCGNSKGSSTPSEEAVPFSAHNWTKLSEMGKELGTRLERCGRTRIPYKICNTWAQHTLTPFTWPLSNRVEPRFTPSRCRMSIFKLGRTQFAQPQLQRWFRPGYNGVRGVKKWRNVARPGRTMDNRRIPLLSMVGRWDSEAHRSVERENSTDSGRRTTSLRWRLEQSCVHRKRKVGLPILKFRLHSTSSQFITTLEKKDWLLGFIHSILLCLVALDRCRRQTNSARTTKFSCDVAKPGRNWFS